MLLSRLNKYQEATRGFHRDLLTDNKKIIQAHNQVPAGSGRNVHRESAKKPSQRRESWLPQGFHQHNKMPCRS